MDKGRLVDWIISGVISLFVANYGFTFLQENKIIGILMMILAFLILYITGYSSQIKENKKKIIELEEEIKDTKENLEIKAKLLKDIRDIILIKRIKNEK